MAAEAISNVGEKGGIGDREINYLTDCGESAHKIINRVKKTATAAYSVPNAASTISAARATMKNMMDHLLPSIDQMLFADKSSTSMNDVKTLLKSIAVEMASLLQNEKEMKALLRSQKA